MMFCPKCGAKIIDSAVFCQKCGAKLTVDDAAPKAADVPVQQTQPQTDNVPVDVPKKTKSKKLPIIIGVATLVIILIVAIAVSTSNNEVDYASISELTQSFASESDGISFQYPKAWKVQDNENDALVVRMFNSDIYSFISVWKFTEMPTITENLYNMSDELFIETLASQDGNEIESTTTVNINGILARELCFSAPDSNVDTIY